MKPSLQHPEAQDRDPSGHDTPCRHFEELLPWFFAGSLDRVEAEAVERHLSSCAACGREAFEVDAVWRLLDVHVPPADLVAVGLGEPPVDWSRAQIDRHLAACAHCREELATLRATEAEWPHDEDVPTFEAPRLLPFRRPQRPSHAVMALAAAAALVLASLGWIRTTYQAPKDVGAATAGSVGGDSFESAPEGATETRTAPEPLFRDAFERDLTTQWTVVKDSDAIQKEDFEFGEDTTLEFNT